MLQQTWLCLALDAALTIAHNRTSPPLEADC
jgi:hypothetical protein